MLNTNNMMLKLPRKTILGIIAVFILCAIVYNNLPVKAFVVPPTPKMKTIKTFSAKPGEPLYNHNTCPGVLTAMMKGEWKTRPLTKQENKEINVFLKQTHSGYDLPQNYQRRDGLCGNVTYGKSGKSRNYRALCNPKGPTPCCFHNKCVSKRSEECTCQGCYDMRNVKHAEYSKWTPSHPGCTYHEHTSEEACEILDGMNIAFVGDSHIRHVYTAMLLLVTGNMKDGAVSPGTDDDSRNQCKGMYMFTEKLCRLVLNRSTKACDGKVELSFQPYYEVRYARQFYNVAKIASFLFAGIGIHDNYNHTQVQNIYLKPVLSLLNSSKKNEPHLLWVSPHAPGILKSPKYAQQTDINVHRFNREMENFLKLWNVPIFDTYPLTKGMISFDGQHYGMGINIAKANLLLSYIKEQKAKHDIKTKLIGDI